MFKSRCFNKPDLIYEKISLFLLFLLAVRVFYYLVMYGDSFPQWDEWNYVPVWFPLYKYLFDFNNENLQFFTNVQFALVQYLGLPFKANVFFSYGIYLVLIVRFYLFLRQYIKFSRWLLAISFVPLFSDYMVDNILWPLLSQTWFYLLFMLEAVRYGFSVPHRIQDRIMAAIMISLSVLSMNVTFVILFLGVYLLKNIYNAKTSKERYKELLFSAMCLEYMALILIVFFYFMRKVDNTEIDFSVLFSLSFYQQLAYFFASPLFGLWSKPDNVVINLILFSVISGGILSLFVRQIKNTERQSVWSLFLILFGSIVAITIFRGDLVYHIETDACRYLPFVLFLFPVILGIVSGERNQMVKKISYLVVFLMFGFSFVGLYGGRHQETILRIKNADLCVQTYYNAKIRPVAYYCPNKYLKSIASKLEHFENEFLK